MKPIRIFRHVTCEGPGYLADTLQHYGLPFELVCIDQGEAVPPQVDDVSALVFMGGPMSANDDQPWIRDELALIRRAAADNLPLLGHCLGGQLIAKALGGTIGANPVKEIGWLPVQKLATAAADDWLQGLADNIPLFHWHGETFSIPAGATAILRSEHCAHQAFTVGNTLALQCHVEMTAEMVREWAALYEDELAAPSDTVQSLATMTTDLEQKIKGLQTVADQLYRRWLRPLVD
jgi:GMP synthase-like glutamine amidotransferase